MLLSLFIITIFQVSKCSLWPNVTHSHLTRESLQDIFSGSCSGSWGITNTRWGITKTRWGITNTRWGITKTRWGITNTRWGNTNTRWGITKTRWGITNTRWGNTNTRWGITNTRLGIAAPGLGALDEPKVSYKPAQRSCFTGPPGYLHVFSILTLFIVWRYKCIFKITIVHHKSCCCCYAIQFYEFLQGS